MSESEESKILKFLKFIDLFSYIPVPQAYPVSTSKSRVGSIAVIMILVGYLIYDFYIFVTKSVPTLNVYQSNFVDKGTSLMPQISFGMKYADLYNDQQYIVNSSYYFTFALFAGMVESSSLDILSSKTDLVSVQMQPCAKNSWGYNISSNLTCPYFSFASTQQLNSITWSVNDNGNLLMSVKMVNKTIMSMVFILQLSICIENGCSNNQTQIKQFLQFSQFVIYINQPSAYDYAEAAPVTLPFPQNIQFYVSDINYDNLLISFYECITTNFIISPNYLTSFSKSYANFTRINKGESYVFYYSPKDLLARFTFRPRITMNMIEVHFQTIILRLSSWSALVGFIFFLTTICFLGYNQRKFIKKNPEWKQFDKVLRQKMLLQMQTMRKKNQQSIYNDQQNNKQKQNENQKFSISI